MGRATQEEEERGEVLRGFTIVVKYEVFKDGEAATTGIYGQFKEHVDMPLEEAARNPDAFKAARRQLAAAMGEVVRRAARGYRSWEKAGRTSEAKIKE